VSKAGVEVALHIFNFAEIRSLQREIKAELLNDILSLTDITASQTLPPGHQLAISGFEQALDVYGLRLFTSLRFKSLHLPLWSG
jgi:hypothetical protein